MRIAGVDPGTIFTGVGVLEVLGQKVKLLFSGTIRAGRNREIAERLETVYVELKAVFQEWKPDVLALENVFYQKDFQAAVRVGEARAAAMIAARRCRIPVTEYTPARVKQAICGNGRASKEQVQYMVARLLNLSGPLNADAADALAVGLCYANAHRFAEVVRKSSGVLKEGGFDTVAPRR